MYVFITFYHAYIGWLLQLKIIWIRKFIINVCRTFCKIMEEFQNAPKNLKICRKMYCHAYMYIHCLKFSKMLQLSGKGGKVTSAIVCNGKSSFYTFSTNQKFTFIMCTVVHICPILLKFGKDLYIQLYTYNIRGHLPFRLHLHSVFKYKFAGLSCIC